MSAKLLNPGFRTDINGLRAWAVMSVILYHFGFTLASGGFIGVDIFFVISGFLMTRIIVSGLEKSTAGRAGFSILDFYLARARRIIPALLGVCLALLAFGWHFLSVKEYALLGENVVTALTFVSNIEFWRETGYFSPHVHDIWLLHTWSLSVEWQFYLLLPVGLALLWKLWPSRRAVAVVFVLGAMASLGLAVWLSAAKASTGFFLLPPRAWELLAGGLVFMLGERLALSARQAVTLEFAGFAAILVALFLYDSHSVWPGWRALLPVTGAGLVLLAARSGSWWTGTRAAQWLGDCSYSLYLWHWPVVCALAYLELERSPVALATGLALTFVAGRLSYAYIENAARFRLSSLSRSGGALALAALMLVAILPGGLLYAGKAPAGRLDGRVDAVFAAAGEPAPVSACMQASGHAGDGCDDSIGAQGVVVVGDSHAHALLSGVKGVLPKDFHLLDWSMAGCATATGMKGTKFSGDQGCADFVDWILRRQAVLPAQVPVLIINRSSLYSIGPNEPGQEYDVQVPNIYFTHPHAARTPAFIRELHEHTVAGICAIQAHHPVFLLRPVPEMGLNVPQSTARSMLLGHPRELSMSLPEYHRRNDLAWSIQDAAKEKCGVTILDPTPLLCPDGICRASLDGLPIYADDNHLNARGAALLAPLFTRMLRDAYPTVAALHH